MLSLGVMQLANKLDNAVEATEREPLGVMVQVHIFSETLSESATATCLPFCGARKGQLGAVCRFRA